MSGSALGKRGVSAEAVGETAAKDLIEDIRSGGAVDRYTQDQVFSN
jgi:RNA 3'-terminal phosphate cyclase (ATP)